MTETHAPSTPFFPAAAEARDLEDWGPLAEATGPEMHTSGITIWQDGDDEAGIWECTPGPSRWLLETNELVHIVKGRMTVTVDGGEAVELGPGDTAVFPKGWSGTWEIHEPLRKVYAIY
ncbi:MAG TPA: cupin domain-containing protein [Acidimicrobiales bacterium]|nr:cupin domain-containing protein [Acidimicrobiales bacterium]